MNKFKWLISTNAGLYCKPADLYIDPIIPVQNAIVSHAHNDHAKPGHERVLATQHTLNMMQIRYGDCATHYHALNYHETIKIHDLKVTLLPAGHILGSAQVLLEYKNLRALITSDFKRQIDLTCEPHQSTDCDLLIIEATFGLPIFKHPPIQDELTRLLVSLKNFPERCHLIGAYALGKCQRFIYEIRTLGYDLPIFLHGAMQRLCEYYQQQGFHLGQLNNVMETAHEDLRGKIVICPPSALHSLWSRRLPDVIKGYASGWMQTRARAKQKAIEIPLVISDHADWNELTQTITEIHAPEVWASYGHTDALAYYTNQQGYLANALELYGYDEEEGET